MSNVTHIRCLSIVILSIVIVGIVVVSFWVYIYTHTLFCMLDIFTVMSQNYWHYKNGPAYKEQWVNLLQESFMRLTPGACVIKLTTAVIYGFP